ncbi:retrovirus-related Pol polyprotein from transposon TNT 1-94 [Trichonephila clavipes]|nr:retrovirus-related Pol polyprotein from transposon TNT 1-94 [Trichonephila clavipes]
MGKSFQIQHRNERCIFCFILSNLTQNESTVTLPVSVSNECKPLIYGTTDGAEAWKILQEHFETTTRARIIQLLDEFFGTRYVPGESLGLFICRVKHSAEHLREVGHDLPPLYQGYQMIRSLPDDFRSTVQAIY